MTHDKLFTLERCAVILLNQEFQRDSSHSQLDRQMQLQELTKLVKAAKILGVPTLLTTITTEGSISQPKPELFDVNYRCLWAEKKLLAAVTKIGCQRLLFVGSHSDICRSPASVAVALGYVVYIAIDSCRELEASQWYQLGIVPVTWSQIFLKFSPADSSGK